MYNILFTFVPIIAVGILDQYVQIYQFLCHWIQLFRDVPENKVEKFPELYELGRKHTQVFIILFSPSIWPIIPVQLEDILLLDFHWCFTFLGNKQHHSKWIENNPVVDLLLCQSIWDPRSDLQRGSSCWTLHYESLCLHLRSFSSFWETGSWNKAMKSSVYVIFLWIFFRHWNWITTLTLGGCLSLWVLFLLVYGTLYSWLPALNVGEEVSYLVFIIFRAPTFYFGVGITVALCLLGDYIWKW